MNPETITDLGYIIQLFYPPKILNKNSLRKIYVELGGALCLTESKEFPDGIQFVSQPLEGREIVKYLIKEDSTIIHGEFITGGLELFWRRTEMLTKRVGEILKIPIFFSQVCVVRILATPKPVNDSREFIGNMVCSFQPENLSFFKRPAQAVGLRFFFPPMPNTPYEFDVKVESKITDITKIWMENKARFFKPIPPDNLSIIWDNLCITRDFLVENVTQFLSQYNEQKNK